MATIAWLARYCQRLGMPGWHLACLQGEHCRGAWSEAAVFALNHITTENTVTLAACQVQAGRACAHRPSSWSGPVFYGFGHSDPAVANIGPQGGPYQLG